MKGESRADAARGGHRAGFYNLLMLDAQMGIARRNLALSDSTLLVTRLQRDAGDVPPWRWSRRVPETIYCRPDPADRTGYRHPGECPERADGGEPVVINARSAWWISGCLKASLPGFPPLS